VKQTTPVLWTFKERQELARLWREGLYDKQIARALNRPIGSVAAQRANLGLIRKAFPGDRRDQALALYRSGLADTEIAAAMSAHKNQVLRWRAREGLPANVACNFHGAGRFTDAQRKGWKRHRREMAKAVGEKNWGRYLVRTRRVKYITRAFGCVSRAEVAVVTALRKGPMSVEQLAAACPELSRRRLARVARKLALCKGTGQLQALVVSDGKRRPTYSLSPYCRAKVEGLPLCGQPLGEKRA
jgi:hypothetical protein